MIADMVRSQQLLTTFQSFRMSLMKKGLKGRIRQSIRTLFLQREILLVCTVIRAIRILFHFRRLGVELGKDNKREEPISETWQNLVYSCCS